MPLFGAFYAKKPSPRAALVSIVGGASTRIILEFPLTKDGSLLLPFDDPEFLKFGAGASAGYPLFMDVNETEKWDPNIPVEECVQELHTD